LRSGFTGSSGATGPVGLDGTKSFSGNAIDTGVLISLAANDNDDMSSNLPKVMSFSAENLIT